MRPSKSEEALSKFFIKIMTAVSNEALISSKIVHSLDTLLHSNKIPERKIASVCLLYLSQKCKYLFKELKHENLIKEIGNLAVIGLEDTGCSKKMTLLAPTMSFIDNTSCPDTGKFYLKFGSLGYRKTEIITITEIKHYLNEKNFEKFPDPREYILWTAAKPQTEEDQEDMSMMSLSPRKTMKTKNFVIKHKRSLSLQGSLVQASSQDLRRKTLMMPTLGRRRSNNYLKKKKRKLTIFQNMSPTRKMMSPVRKIRSKMGGFSARKNSSGSGSGSGLNREYSRIKVSKFGGFFQKIKPKKKRENTLKINLKKAKTYSIPKLE